MIDFWIMPAQPSPLTRDILLFTARQAVGFWGAFERPWSITYPLYRDVERALAKASYAKPAIQTTIKRLVYRQYLKIQEKEGGHVVVITERGKRRVLDYRLQRVGIPVPTKWDGRWRTIIFDIPNTRKTAREVFRGGLKRLGFQMLQESVAIHPFPCRDEAYLLAATYGVLPYVRFLEVTLVDPDEDVLRSFGLNKLNA